MGIYQENREDAPRPEVSETEYGAKYVTASTETPVVETPDDSVPAEEAVPKRKVARPRRTNRKKQ